MKRLKQLHIGIVNERWQFFIGEWNWYTFDFIKIDIDLDHSIWHNEVQIVVLWLGIRIWYMSEAQIKKREKEIEQAEIKKLDI